MTEITLIDDATLAEINDADTSRRAAALWWQAWLRANNPDVEIFDDEFLKALHTLLVAARYGSISLVAHDRDPNKMIESYRKAFAARILADALYGFGITYDKVNEQFVYNGQTLQLGYVSMSVTANTVTVVTNTDDEVVVWHQPEPA
ncbi:hypothetical protein KDA23_02865 [Candidatus Saccharibacteria bacterium]|nr:hypothetical protein [Candidatus Saccharibacteria bacterium]